MLFNKPVVMILTNILGRCGALRKWRTLFFLLLGLNVLFIMILVMLLKAPANETKDMPGEIAVEEYIPFVITSNKKDVTLLANRYIEKEGLNKAIQYELALTDQVELVGMIKVFGQPIDLTIRFEPEVVDEGNVLLKKSTMSIGQLPIPASYVLEFIREGYDLPEWVTIQPKDEKVYIDLKSLTMKNGAKVKMNKFDLANDSIHFTLYIENK